MTRLDSILAAAVVAALAAGCATGGPPESRDAAAQPSAPDRAIGLKTTIDDNYRIRDMVRPPGYQSGNTMGGRTGH
jgi:hypothetical protein